MKAFKLAVVFGLAFGFSSAYAHCGSCAADGSKPGHKHDKPAACAKKCEKAKDKKACKESCKKAAAKK